MLRNGNGAVGFFPHFVGTPLLMRALETDSVSKSLEWLNSVLSTKSAHGKIIQIISGANIESDIRLCEGISLVTSDSLFASGDRLKLKHRRQGNELLQVVYGIQKPTSISAIIKDVVIEPVVVDVGHGGWQSYADSVPISDICLLLTLAGKSPVIEFLQWFEYDDLALQYTCNFQSTAINPPELLPHWSATYPHVDVDEASAIVNAFMALDDKSKEKVRYVLYRFRQATLRHNEGDCAVELAISLEALLTDRIENSEIGYKISVRAAKVLGCDLDERRSIHKLIKDMYNVRSKVVHGTNCGKIKNVSEIVKNATMLCARLIGLIICSGVFPNWADFDLS